MIRAVALAMSFICLALPSDGHAKGGPRTLSDYNIQKEYVASPAGKRHFNGMTTRFSTGARHQRRATFPGQTRYPTVELTRAR